MTTPQVYLLSKAREQIDALREILDTVMYRTGGLTEKEYEKVRKAYDLVCSANYQLP